MQKDALKQKGISSFSILLLAVILGISSFALNAYKNTVDAEVEDLRTEIKEASRSAEETEDNINIDSTFEN